MGRSVLVTGGSRGIGREIALRFARDGATRVAIGYMRSDAAAEATAAELRELGAEPILVRGNVTSERVVEGGGRAVRGPANSHRLGRAALVGAGDPAPPSRGLKAAARWDDRS